MTVGYTPGKAKLTERVREALIVVL